MKLRHFALAIALSAVAGAAQAEFFDGNKLLSVCEKGERDMADFGDCIGYISGVYDAISGVVICPDEHPGRRTRGQVRDIVVRHLLLNPQSRSATADVLIRDALMPLWPCRNGTNARPSSGRTL